MKTYNDVKVIKALWKDFPINSFVEFIKQGSFKIEIDILDCQDDKLLVEYNRDVIFFIFPFPLTKDMKNPRVTINDTVLSLRDYSRNSLFSNDKENNLAFMGEVFSMKRHQFIASTKSGNYNEESYATLFDTGDEIFVETKRTRIKVANPYCIISSRMAPYYTSFAVDGLGIDLTAHKTKRLNDTIIVEGDFADFKQSLKRLAHEAQTCLFELQTE